MRKRRRSRILLFGCLAEPVPDTTPLFMCQPVLHGSALLRRVEGESALHGIMLLPLVEGVCGPGS